jgi:nucleoid-associated protein YgaU
MMRSQIVALLFGSAAGVLAVAGLAWRAYAPDDAIKLPFVSTETPGESVVARETPKEAQPPAPQITPDRAQEPPAPPVKTADLAALPPRVPDEAAAPRPQFDIVRIEPNGDSVVAGRSRVATKVELVAGGKVVAETMTDASGHFVVTPHLPVGNYELTLRDGSVTSRQSVTVALARKPGDKSFAALTEPEKPTILLTAPPADRTKDSVSFVTAEIDKKAFYATGNAKPHAHVRLYADEKALADVLAGSDGFWSLRVESRLPAGHHRLRADSVDPAGKVTARAEIPFEAPADIVADNGEVALVRVDPSTVDRDKGKSTVVQRGDNLWRISRRLLGNGLRYTQIYDANTGQIRNPNLIYPGQVFIVPEPAR